MKLADYYNLNFLLMTVHKYSLTEIENMMPFERDIYISMLVDYLEKKKQEQARQADQE